MDAVYIVKKPNSGNFEELRYSLRSLETNMIDLENVYIVGDVPDWITNVIHIPVGDPYRNRWDNTLNKVQKACKDERISADFLHMNDDFYAFLPFSGEEMPFYGLKHVDGGIDGPHNFDCHKPKKINKEVFLHLPIFPECKDFRKYISMYCNLTGASPVLTTHSIILPAHPDSLEIGRKPGDEFKTTLDDQIHDPAVMAFLEENFPVPSRYERLDL